MINIKDLMIDKNNEAYFNSLNRKYNEFIRASDLPSVYLNHNIDISSLSSRYKILNDNIYNIVYNRYNFIFNVENYDYGGYLTSLLLDSYFTSSVENDNILEMILYVDTNLLLDDYKKLMDTPDFGVRITTSHSLDTLNKNIENAACVIWDRFSLINSTYDKQKLYNIMLTRYRRQLCNLFFIENQKDVMANVLGVDMFKVMNINQIVDFSTQVMKFKPTNKDGGMLW